MMDILTKPKVVELSKLYDAMIQFRFARSRLRKYGHVEPEPSQLFETLKVAASALIEKEPELQFRFQHYLMKHSSVNGLVSEQTVQEMYDMIVENARSVLDVPPSADAKALQSGTKDRKKPYEQSALRNQADFACLGVDLRTIGLRIVHTNKLFSNRYLSSIKVLHRSRICPIRFKEVPAYGPTAEERRQSKG